MKNLSLVILNPKVETINFEEDHDVIVQLDTRSDIAETNEGDNTSSIRYTLNQSACG